MQVGRASPTHVNAIADDAAVELAGRVDEGVERMRGIKIALGTDANVLQDEMVCAMQDSCPSTFSYLSLPT